MESLYNRSILESTCEWNVVVLRSTCKHNCVRANSKTAFYKYAMPKTQTVTTMQQIDRCFYLRGRGVPIPFICYCLKFESQPLANHRPCRERPPMLDLLRYKRVAHLTGCSTPCDPPPSDTCCWFLSCCCRNLNQTADLAGRGPICLIRGTTNEWLISLGARPHARFLDH